MEIFDTRFNTWLLPGETIIKKKDLKMNTKEENEHLEKLAELNSHLSHKYMIDNNIRPWEMGYKDVKMLHIWVEQEKMKYYESLKYFYGQDRAGEIKKDKK